MSEFVHKKRVGEVTIWTLDRPAARNAINHDVVAELETALSEAEQDTALRAAILTGTGDAAFVSGADLKLLSGGTPELRAEVDARVHALLARIEALPVPVFAAINGAVLGGGCEVALACDMRIAEAHVSIAFRHAALSMTPGWGGLARLCRTVAPGTAAKLFFTALPIGAEEAQRLGLVDEVVPKGKAEERALAIARAVEEVSPSAIADLKQLLKLGYSGQLTPELERRTFLARCESRDHLEALAAFRERRKPIFGPRS